MLEVAERQEGVIARHQLEEWLTGGEISRWLAQSRIHRVHPGVYTLGHRGLTPRGRLIAGLLYAGRGAALGGATAAAHYDLIDLPPRAPIEVWTPHRRKPVPGVRPVFRRSLTRIVHDGLPVTPVPETLLALATTLPTRRLRRVLAEADFRRLLHPAEVEAACARRRPGSRALRRALEAHLPSLAYSRSELEERFLELCERANLPLPKLNAKVGPFTIDAFFRDHGLAVELDGGTAHGRPAAVIQDRYRELYLRERGYRVVRYSWWQGTGEPERVAADLRRVLAEPQPSASL